MIAPLGDAMQAAKVRRAHLLSTAWLGAAAVVGVCTDAHAQEAGPFRAERFDEDWPATPSPDAPAGAELKNMALAPGLTLSLGGDARWRFAYLDAPRLGLGGIESDEWVLQRMLLHADLRIGDDVRLFLQLGAHDGIDRELPSLSDDNRLDLQQAFLDISTALGQGRATLRVGRQELALGPRFATTRDTLNSRQRHDMVRFFYVEGPWRADLFGGRPTRDQRGVFDDVADETQMFWGLRLQHTGRDRSFAIYAYRLDREDVSIAGVIADDERLSVGARLWGRSGAYDFDVEAMLQGGAFGDQDVTAFGGAVDIGRRLDAPLDPRVGVRFTYGSGDHQAGDGAQNTFAPPFPSGSWFGQNGMASFSNVAELAGTLALSPSSTITINAKVAALWRAQTADFLYNGATALAGTDGADDAFVGFAPALMLTWRANANVTLNTYVSYLAIDDELEALGARDVAYAHVAISLRF